MTPPRFTLISTVVLSAAALLIIILNTSATDYFSPVVYRILVLWASFSSTWLTPPYLYLFLNFIIVTIAASSRLERRPLLARTSDSDRFGFCCEVKEWRRPSQDSGFEDKFVVLKSSAWDDPAKKRIESLDNYSMESKCLVSARFGDQKPVKVSLEGRRTAPSVTKQNRSDTLDDTWKKITESRPIPLKKHHKRSDTWQNTKHGISYANDATSESSCLHSTTLPPPAMKKSATFKERTANFRLAGDHHQVIASKPIDDGPTMKKSATFKDRTEFQLRRLSNGGGGRLRKEASLSQDELNHRVEEFINKFNEEMRMQRQESINRYKDMIS